MSSFVVFSMLGFYPVTPGVPIYDLASPVFDRISIRLHNGKTFTIVCHNNSANNKYIQSIRLNGQPQSRLWIKHADLVNGGTLELQMGNTPNQTSASIPPICHPRPWLRIRLHSRNRQNMLSHRTAPSRKKSSLGWLAMPMVPARRCRRQSSP